MPLERNVRPEPLTHVLAELLDPETEPQSSRACAATEAQCRRRRCGISPAFVPGHGPAGLCGASTHGDRA